MAGGRFGRVAAPAVPESYLGRIVKGPVVKSHGEWDADLVVAYVLPQSSAVHDEGGAAAARVGSACADSTSQA